MKKIIQIIILMTTFVFPNYFVLADDFATSTTQTNLVSDSEKVWLYIKNGPETIFADQVELSLSTTTITDNIGDIHIIDQNTVLAVLNQADLVSDGFSINNLQYYSSFDSFLLNCLKIDQTDYCYNWQYVVNNEYPFIGIDDYVLVDGDVIYFYFGQPRKLIVPEIATSSLAFEITAQKYDYQNDTWNALNDYTVGVFVDNPEDQWSPIIIATSTLDEFGKAQFLISDEGVYKIGLSEDYYYPFYQITISSSTNSTSTNEVLDDEVDANGGGSSNENKIKFDIDKAVQFLKTVQDADGGFGKNLYTDWVAIALASIGEFDSSLKTKLKSIRVGSELLDQLRHSMALLSFDLNPNDYDNLIERILTQFDGQQFGDPDLFNDDIFALIVLQKVGFDENDEQISKTIDFILQNQNASGAWDEVDLTAASIQALVNFEMVENVSSALNKAENYLKNKQQNDGSWGNVYSTSWSMMAMTALGREFDDWKGDAEFYISDQQNEDGGLLVGDSNSNRIWSTAYALATVSEKTWIEILADFNKPQNQEFIKSHNNTKDDTKKDSNEEENEDIEILSINSAEPDNNFVPESLSIFSYSNQKISEEITEKVGEVGSGFVLGDTITDIENLNQATDSVDFVKTENNNEDDNQNSITFYLFLASITLIISVIMFRQK